MVIIFPTKNNTGETFRDWVIDHHKSDSVFLIFLGVINNMILYFILFRFFDSGSSLVCANREGGQAHCIPPRAFPLGRPVSDERSRSQSLFQ